MMTKAPRQTGDRAGRHCICAWGLALALGITLGAKAQIYQDTDAQGNPVFTDKPSPEAVEVNLPPSNIADAPPDIPESAPAEEPPAPATPVAEEKPEQVRIVNNPDLDDVRRIRDRDDPRKRVEAQPHEGTRKVAPHRQGGHHR